MDTVSGNKKVMDKWTDIISESSLFKGVEKNETAAMIKCLDVRFEKVDKGQYVLHDGDTVERIGMVIEGEVSIEQEDYWGNRHIMAYAKAGDIFGEAYACSNNKVCNVSVVAMKAGTIAYLDTYRVITVCSESCQFHNKLIRNLMYMLADRCVNMNEKITHMSKRTTRDKLLSYLSSQSNRSGSNEFDIPFNRQQLADYLSVDRSAMSSELRRCRPCFRSRGGCPWCRPSPGPRRRRRGPSTRPTAARSMPSGPGRHEKEPPAGAFQRAAFFIQSRFTRKSPRAAASARRCLSAARASSIPPMIWLDTRKPRGVRCQRPSSSTA